MFVVFDLEAESTGIPKKPLGEVIQFGCVFVSSDLQIVGTFKQNVKPTLNPQISQYVQQLTGIRQEDVDAANDLKTVLDNFAVECEKKFKLYPHQIQSISWGADHLFLEKECIKKKIEYPLGEHLDLQYKFTKHHKIQRCGLKKAMEMLNIEPEGSAHDSLSDAINTTKIFITWQSN